MVTPLGLRRKVMKGRLSEDFTDGAQRSLGVVVFFFCGLNICGVLFEQQIPHHGFDLLSLVIYKYIYRFEIRDLRNWEILREVSKRFDDWTTLTQK